MAPALLQQMNRDMLSLTQRICFAVTSELSRLLDAVIKQSSEVASEAPCYFIEVEENHERLALELRNSLRQEGLEFKIQRHEKKLLFIIFGNISDWISRLHNEGSRLFASMEFA